MLARTAAPPERLEAFLFSLEFRDHLASGQGAALRARVVGDGHATSSQLQITSRP
jgi:hypothetical protein